MLTTFGIANLHIYERYAGYPQAFAVFVLIGASGRQWNTSLVSIGDGATIKANRCSFFAMGMHLYRKTSKSDQLIMSNVHQFFLASLDSQPSLRISTSIILRTPVEG